MANDSLAFVVTSLENVISPISSLFWPGKLWTSRKKKISSARHTFLGQVGSIILQQEVTSISLSPNYCFNSQAWTWAYSSECFPTPNWLDGVRVEWNIDEDKGEQVAGKVDNHAWQKQRQRTTSRGSVLFLKDMERPRKKHQRRWATFWSLVS